jgi:hypothetical protein
MATSKNMGRPVKNKYGVPKKQWEKWSNHARKVFNDMFVSLRPRNQFVYLPPDSPLLPKTSWEVLQWNVSWMAAASADNSPYTKIQDVDPRTGKHVGKAHKL